MSAGSAARSDLHARQARHDVFQAIADPTRRRLLKLLAEEELPVAAITERFPITRTAINKHLAMLTDAGLVERRRIGRETRYKLQPQPLSEVRQWLDFFEAYWADKLSALKRFVEQENEE